MGTQTVWRTEYSDTTGEEYSVKLVIVDGELDTQLSSCTCPHGSYYRFHKQNGKPDCKHMWRALRKHDEEEAEKFKKKLQFKEE